MGTGSLSFLPQEGSLVASDRQGPQMAKDQGGSPGFEEGHEGQALEKDMKGTREPGTPPVLLCPAHCLMMTSRVTGERVLNFAVGP